MKKETKNKAKQLRQHAKELLAEADLVEQYDGVDELIDEWKTIQVYRDEIAVLQNNHGITDRKLKSSHEIHHYRLKANATNDKNAKWIKTYLVKGGKLEQLETNATDWIAKKAKQAVAKKGKSKTASNDDDSVTKTEKKGKSKKTASVKKAVKNVKRNRKTKSSLAIGKDGIRSEV